MATMGTRRSRQKRPNSASPARMCLTYGQWLQMKMTTLGRPASADEARTRPLFVSGSEKLGISVPSETMRDGVAAFAAGHYAKAEKLAVGAIELGEAAEINALIAARCAHALKAFERRDAHLADIGKTVSDYPESGMTPDQ